MQVQTFPSGATAAFGQYEWLAVTVIKTISGRSSSLLTVGRRAQWVLRPTSSNAISGILSSLGSCASLPTPRQFYEH